MTGVGQLIGASLNGCSAGHGKHRVRLALGFAVDGPIADVVAAIFVDDDRGLADKTGLVIAGLRPFSFQKQVIPIRSLKQLCLLIFAVRHRPSFDIQSNDRRRSWIIEYRYPNQIQPAWNHKLAITLNDFKQLTARCSHVWHGRRCYPEQKAG